LTFGMTPFPGQVALCGGFVSLFFDGCLLVSRVCER
jgi:hypothetical protein